MSRYIDTDDIMFKGFKYMADGEIFVRLPDVKMAINRTPTAEVVPREMLINMGRKNYEKVKRIEELERLNSNLKQTLTKAGAIRQSYDGANCNACGAERWACCTCKRNPLLADNFKLKALRNPINGQITEDE